MPGLSSDDLAYKSIRELSGLIQSRQLSPVDLVEASLSRIVERNPSLNAFVYLNQEFALDRARAVEARVLAGEAVTLLEGLPTAIKDLADSRPGWTGTLGSIPALKDYVIDAYCNYAERMERAGAIPLGKTNSPTMGFRAICDNYLFGPTRNPFDLTRNSGGSSGGSAAAVADGMVPFAEGTDGGGSIRIPAAWCGIFGFKGTSGRVARLARPSAFSSSSLFTFEGCLTRSVEDTAYVMEYLCGPDNRDPYSLTDMVDWLGSTNGSIEGKKIAYSPDLGVFPTDQRVLAVVEKALSAFDEAGAVVEEVSMDLHHSALELGDLWCRLMSPTNVLRIEGLKAQGLDLRKDYPRDLPPEMTYWMDVVSNQTLSDVAKDQAIRTTVYDAIREVMDGYDLLITPTLSCLPVENGDDGNTLGPEEINGEAINRLIGWCPTFVFNFTGHPAASVPAGLVEGKWPVGLQIVGQRFADADVIAASACFEAIRPWRQDLEIVRSRAVK